MAALLVRPFDHLAKTGQDRVMGKTGVAGAWKDLAPVERQPRLYEQVAHRIQTIIQESGMKPGDQLPPERLLAEQLGISRPSLREAMIALETAGLVEVRTGDGTYVRAIAAELRLPWAVPNSGDPGPGVREQFEARKLIEPALAAMAALAAKPGDIAILEAAVERAAQNFAQGEPAEEEDYAFHVGLAEISGNSVLAGFDRQLWDLRRTLMWKTLRGRVVKPKHRQQVIADRHAIIAALKARDADTARRIVERFLARAEKRYFGDEP
jgi:DNA-binding FadR family transcriptional regulator